MAINEKEVKAELTLTDDKKRVEVPIKLPVCWIEDYSKEISVNPTGRYSESYNKAGASNSLNVGQRKYKIYVPVKTSTDVTVEIRFKVVSKLTPSPVVAAGGIGAVAGVAGTALVASAALSAAKTKLEDGITAHWNGKFTLTVVDPICGKKSFTIKFKAVWVDSGEHYTLNVHSSYPREGVTGLVVNVSAATTAWVYAHEFGHCFGLPDEYSYSADTETVKYYKPDGTLDAAITAPPNGKAKNATDATIMAAFDTIVTLKRHAWNIAIEVQELLTAKIGRKLTCDIK